MVSGLGLSWLKGPGFSGMTRVSEGRSRFPSPGKNDSLIPNEASLATTNPGLGFRV